MDSSQLAKHSLPAVFPSLLSGPLPKPKTSPNQNSNHRDNSAHHHLPAQKSDQVPKRLSFPFGVEGKELKLLLFTQILRRVVLSKKVIMSWCNEHFKLLIVILLYLDQLLQVINFSVAGTALEVGESHITVDGLTRDILMIK